MTVARKKFERRVGEVEKYFKFLSAILDPDTRLFNSKKKTWKYTSIEDDLQKILKANSFLILYNLVESAIRTGVQEIFDNIIAESTTYQEIIDELRKEWVREKLKSLEASGTQHVKYRDAAQSLIDAVISGEAIALQAEDLPISGNIDAKKIRELGGSLGFSTSTHPRTRGGEKLLTVKEKRNSLAHGEFSFAEVGRDIVVSELNDIKKEVIMYLRNILGNLQKFSEGSMYNR